MAPRSPICIARILSCHAMLFAIKEVLADIKYGHESAWVCRFQQQLKGNPALANKWEAKREDVQQRVSQSAFVCMLGLVDALLAGCARESGTRTCNTKLSWHAGQKVCLKCLQHFLKG